MKGQLGTETMIVFTVLTFFLLMMTVFYISQNEDIAITGSYLDASKVCFDLKNTIDAVASSNNNSKISLTLPKKIGQKDYSFSIESENRVVRIIWDSSSYTCPIFSNVAISYTALGLVGSWRFEEGSGSSTAIDSSGYGNTGTLTNMNTTGNATSGWTTDCKYGSCLKFDGVDDYVQTASGPGITGAQVRSVSFWSYTQILPSADARGTVVLGFGSQAQYNYYQMVILSSGAWNLWGSAYDFNPGINVVLNTWEFHSLTFDGTNMIWYRNGINVSSGDMSSLNTGDIGYIRIGTAIINPHWYNGYFNGTIDEVRIYNRPLSAEEIWQSFTSFRFDVYNSDGNVIVQRS